MFDLQPTLCDDLLLLRPARPDDWDALFAVAADPQIWAVHPASDRYQESVFRAYFDEGIDSGGLLLIIDKASGSIIGSSRYGDHEVDRRAIEIGWTFLARSHWGGLYNRSSKRLMLRHAFQFVDTVDFIVGEDNVISRRAMEKIGGQLTDRSIDRMLGGMSKRNVIFEISKSDFLASHLHLESL